ncbi:hypothetical protein BDV93DRAFT_548333 [Ceratobasidium sp. AG-I]|nr:hypothetical protein BDV93DRAFT_548333 [Ceratobasidium sp. AG-I]
MNRTLSTYGLASSALQQWVDARTHLSKAIQAYIGASTSLESACTPFSIKSSPGIMDVVGENLKTLEHEEVDFHRTQAALKKKRNTYVSPIYALPSELLAYVFTATVHPGRSCASNEQVKRDLSRVCSHWRQVALDVCPFWAQSALTCTIDQTLQGKMAEAMMELSRMHDVYVDVPIHRQPGLDDASYIQEIRDTIAPYIKQLHKIDLTTEGVEQLRPFLDLWLEKGAVGSVTELDLAVEEAPQIFAETNSRLGDRLRQCLRHLDNLSLCSVGLDWSSVTFDTLTSMSLSNLPSSCCPTLVQLARLLSTCPDLGYLILKDITFPVCLDPTPETAVLEQLEYLHLAEVDLRSLLPILSPQNSELHLELPCPIEDIDTLESLLSFVGRANMHELTVTLSETRFDQALVRLLHPVSSPLLGLQKLTLLNMNLDDSELSELAMHSFVHDSAILASASIGTASEVPQTRGLELWHCIICTSPETLHSAFPSLSWHTLTLYKCRYSPTADGAVDALVKITPASEFGLRLTELRPDWVNLGAS